MLNDTRHANCIAVGKVRISLNTFYWMRTNILRTPDTYLRTVVVYGTSIKVLIEISNLICAGPLSLSGQGEVRHASGLGARCSRQAHAHSHLAKRSALVQVARGKAGQAF